MNPIILIGQGGNRTRLVIDILKAMDLNQERLYLLKSSVPSNDCISLRKVNIHNLFNILDIIKEHKKFNFDISNCDIDNKILNILKKFKKLVLEEIANIKPKVIYFKEPRIRYLLPYFRIIFRNMRIIYIDRKNYSYMNHFESNVNLYNNYFNSNKKYLTLKDKIKFSQSIKKHNINFLKKYNIDYCIINTDNLVNRKNYINVINKLKKFMNIYKGNEQFINKIESVIKFKI